MEYRVHFTQFDTGLSREEHLRRAKVAWEASTVPEPWLCLAVRATHQFDVTGVILAELHRCHGVEDNNHAWKALDDSASEWYQSQRPAPWQKVVPYDQVRAGIVAAILRQYSWHHEREARKLEDQK